MIDCCFSQRAIHGLQSTYSHRCPVWARWAYTMTICVLFMYITSAIMFIPSLIAITDQS